MKNQAPVSNASTRHAYIITGPTSGIGRAIALELARHGTIVLIGRDTKKLNEVQGEIESKGGRAVPVVCDLTGLVGCCPYCYIGVDADYHSSFAVQREDHGTRGTS